MIKTALFRRTFGRREQGFFIEKTAARREEEEQWFLIKNTIM